MKSSIDLSSEILRLATQMHLANAELEKLEQKRLSELMKPEATKPMVATIPLHLSFSEMEAILIESTLKHFEYSQVETAQSLGISRSTLWRLINKYKIEVKKQ